MEIFFKICVLALCIMTWKLIIRIEKLEQWKNKMKGIANETPNPANTDNN